MCALLAVVWSGCSMPNPAWTASDSGPGPSTSLPETESVGNTTVSETTTEEPTTATTDPTVTEPTTGTVTSDPSTSTTSSTSTSTTGTSSTSTTTGGVVCKADDSLALQLEFETSFGPVPFSLPTFPTCEGPRFLIGTMEINDGLKVSGDGMCVGGELDSWVKITGNYPELGGPPLAQGACGRVYLHFRPDSETETCRLAAFQIFQEPNLKSGTPPLYAAGSGGLALGPIPFGQMSELKDYTPTAIQSDCVADPAFCEEPEGTATLLWSQLAPPGEVAESADPQDCGEGYSCYNLRAHRHGDEGELSCVSHLDWIIKKKQ